MNPVVVVTGSLNMDFAVYVDRLPAPGETVSGRDFQMLPGGKGANQACAAGRLSSPGAVTRMIGRVGSDIFADHLKASLAAAGVDVSAVHASRAHPTGAAVISIERSGQNAIVVAPGANEALRPEHLRGPFYNGAAWALFQLESPLDTVIAGLALARAASAKTMLDPAPAQPLAPELLSRVDILTPNETEACVLLGLPAASIRMADAPTVAARLRERGPRAVILKLGEQGCFYLGAEGALASPAFTVNPVDTTAAGDTFNAALAVALSEGKPLKESLAFANAAAAISVTRRGAQASVPSRAEVDEFLAGRK